MLSTSTYEGDAQLLRDTLPDLERHIAGGGGLSVRAEIFYLNGSAYLTLTCDTNRRTHDVAVWIEDLLELIRARLPGSFGLVYERDDEASESPGPNAFKVTRLARARYDILEDPFLSPCMPTIED